MTKIKTDSTNLFIPIFVVSKISINWSIGRNRCITFYLILFCCYSFYKTNKVAGNKIC